MANETADVRFEDFWEATDHLWPRDEAHRKFARRVWEVATREAELAAGERVKWACAQHGDMYINDKSYWQCCCGYIHGRCPELTVSGADAAQVAHIRNLSVAEILDA